MKSTDGAITGYHVHIYYDAQTRERAARVRDGLAQFELRLGRWHDNPVGPHPKGMFQAAFLPDAFPRVVPWLMLNRDGLDVLLHPETGDDVADHTVHAVWMGEKLELDVDALR